MSTPSRSRREPAEPERKEVWTTVRGRRARGVFSTADGWVELVADNGLTKTARCGESTAAEVAERLLRELYQRSQASGDD